MPVLGDRARLRAAAAAGCLHAAFSAYWALGGTWLLDTVGQWAVRLATEAPGRAGLALGAVTVVKLLAALLPLAWSAGRLRPAPAWRRLLAVGGWALAAYGGLNVLVSWAVLSGVLETHGDFDRTAQLGHAALWDPLFLVWGLCLATGVRRSA